MSGSTSTLSCRSSGAGAAGCSCVKWNSSFARCVSARSRSSRLFGTVHGRLVDGDADAGEASGRVHAKRAGVRSLAAARAGLLAFVTWQNRRPEVGRGWVKQQRGGLASAAVAPHVVRGGAGAVVTPSGQERTTRRSVGLRARAPAQLRAQLHDGWSFDRPCRSRSDIAPTNSCMLAV